MAFFLAGSNYTSEIILRQKEGRTFLVQLIEVLPEALADVKQLQQLGTAQKVIAKKLETVLSARLKTYGLAIKDLQVMSLLPAKEVLDAMDAKAAMQVIGSQREYMLYKAANSFV